MAAGLALGAGWGDAAEPTGESAWYVSVGLGFRDFEGDEEVKDGVFGLCDVGYEFTEELALELEVSFAPRLAANPSFAAAWRDETGKDWWDATSVFGLALDGLYLFPTLERVVPYCSLGVGWAHYFDELGGGEKNDLSVRLGVGAVYHLTDEWAVRADYRGMVAGRNTEANSLFGLGVRYDWGGLVRGGYVVVSGATDSDGDGLSDAREAELGTDPHDPDTDKDELSDGEEVNVHGTDPLNPDTDYDLLKDGPEVYRHRTNPCDPDTDKGRVNDGHEVLEDGTDPLDPSDDLLLYTLNVEFETDRAEIGGEYFARLDVIAKVLVRDDASTIEIEGHADQREGSSEVYNQDLSERRALAVLEYLATTWNIARARMKAVGYGYSRPVAPNELVQGNSRNRRTEIYVRPSARVE